MYAVGRKCWRANHERARQTQRDRERWWQKEREKTEGKKESESESIICAFPLHLPVTPILPGSYCYFTSCAWVLSRAGKTPQGETDGKKLQYVWSERQRKEESVLSGTNIIFITLYQAVSSFSIISPIPYDYLFLRPGRRGGGGDLRVDFISSGLVK